MEKIIVHTVPVTKSKEKKSFQIILPENAVSITGIVVTCDRYVITKVTIEKMERSAGVLSLFAADTGEQIFSENLHATYQPPTWQKFDGVCFDRQLYLTKKPFEFLDTDQPVLCTLIDGFYKDEAGKILDTVNYNVRIYLRLKLI